MKCEKCQSAKATVHVTERGPSGSFEGHHYCHSCDCYYYPQPICDVPVPTQEQLAAALLEAEAITGRHFTPEEAGEAIAAYLKLMGPRPPEASAD